MIDCSESKLRTIDNGDLSGRAIKRIAKDSRVMQSTAGTYGSATP